MHTFHINNKDFTEGLAWNYISVFILGVSGLFYNVLIEICYNMEAVGMFNQVYSYYIVVSQLAAFGIHNSVLKYVSTAENNTIQLRILQCGILSAIFTSVLTVTSASLLIKIFMNQFSIQKGLLEMCLALPFFSVNKVYLNYLNGCQKMKSYAVFQCLRSIFIAFSILIFYCIHMKAEDISLCFLTGEMVLSAFLFFWCSKGCKWGLNDWDGIKLHILFGSKVFLANLVMELNTKVDILCLSWIVRDDALIGIYSFAVLFAEGFYQFFVVFRRSINPQIAKDKMIVYQINKKKFVCLSMLLAFAVIGVFYTVSIFVSKEYLLGMKPLAIILFSIVCNGYYIILGNYWSQRGMPLQETKTNVITVLTNLCFNVVLIPILGILGAAIATAASYFVYSFMIRRNMEKDLLTTEV